MKTKVTLVNDFHNTSCNVVLDISENGYFIFSTAQKQKIHRVLCGMSDCSCGTFRGQSYYTESEEPFNFEQVTENGTLKINT